jgi:CheY-like chemotaxis protein
VAADPPAKPPAVTPVIAGGGTETLLVVEDDVAVRRWVGRSLEQLGYTVLEARGGAEALALFAGRSGEVALVITDVVMAGMDGGELRDRLAEQAPQLPVLFISGYASEELLGRGFLHNEDELLHKPFDIVALDRCVRSLLGRSAGHRSPPR